MVKRLLFSRDRSRWLGITSFVLACAIALLIIDGGGHAGLTGWVLGLLSGAVPYFYALVTSRRSRDEHPGRDAVHDDE